VLHIGATLRACGFEASEESEPSQKQDTAEGTTVVESPALTGFQVLNATPDGAETTLDEDRGDEAGKSGAKKAAKKRK